MSRPFYHVYNTMALFLGLAFLALGIFPFARSAASSDWERVEGRIVASSVVVEDEYTWSLPLAFKTRVHYRYIVAGVSHDGTRVEFGLGSRLFLVRQFAQRVVDRYPPGKVVSVYYNPAHPGDGVLERSPSLGSSMFWMILGVLLASAGIFMRFAEKWE